MKLKVGSFAFHSPAQLSARIKLAKRFAIAFQISRAGSFYCNVLCNLCFRVLKTSFFTILYEKVTRDRISHGKAFSFKVLPIQLSGKRIIDDDDAMLASFEIQKFFR